MICWSATKDIMFSFSSATKDAFQKFTLLSHDPEGGFPIPICFVAKLSSGRCCSFSSELVQPPLFSEKTIELTREAIIFPSCLLSHHLNNHATYLLNRNLKFFSSGFFGQITPLKIFTLYNSSSLTSIKICHTIKSCWHWSSMNQCSNSIRSLEHDDSLVLKAYAKDSKICEMLIELVNSPNKLLLATSSQRWNSYKLK